MYRRNLDAAQGATTKMAKNNNRNRLEMPGTGKGSPWRRASGRERSKNGGLWQERYGLLFQAIVFVTAFLIVLSRRPDALLHAQFYAEDGKYWYHDAYQYGLRSLLMPQDGYLQTASRLVALLSLLFPFHLAPLIMNLCAVTVQILPVNVFLSSRFSNVGLATRAIGCFVYLALPNSYEVHVNVTNLQWRLGLLACLVLLARPAATWGWKIFDRTVLVLLSFDSVMGAILLPFATYLWWKRRQARAGIAIAALAPGALIQAATLFFSQSRRHGPDGATVARFITILGRQVFLEGLLGIKTVGQLLSYYSEHTLFYAEAFAAIVGIGVLVFALRYSPLEWKLFILFVCMVFSLCLSWPTVARADQVQWDFLLPPSGGNRYFFLPMIAFLGSLLWMVTDAAKSGKLRYFAALLLLLAPIGIVRDWTYPQFFDLHFPQFAAWFERAPTGTTITIPINPSWNMELTKR